MNTVSFFSKILLFGEYGIIRDSMGLAVPYPLFQGHLEFPVGRFESNISVDSELKTFSHYLREVRKEHDLLESIDIDSFEFDISRGLKFCSTIPQGFGVGSSGALCASVFERYSQNKDRESDLIIVPEILMKLKKIFSIMESHFHGASSGFDPLVSFLNRPILIKSIDDVAIAKLPKFEKKSLSGMFLLNTKRPRRTEPLVNLFLEKLNSKNFRDSCEDTLLPITNACINSFMNGSTDDLCDYFCELSSFQYHNFTQMIPKLMRPLWDKGLTSKKFYLKLCGAGGGGFLLGITKDFNVARELLSGHEIRPLFFF